MTPEFSDSPGLLGWSGLHRQLGVGGPFLERGRVDGDVGEAETGHREGIGRRGDAAAAVGDVAGAAIGVVERCQLVVGTEAAVLIGATLRNHSFFMGAALARLVPIVIEE